MKVPFFFLLSALFSVSQGGCPDGSCDGRRALVETDKTFYRHGQDIVVEFDDGGMQPIRHWIGIYDARSDRDNLMKPLLWLYSCGTQHCTNTRSSGFVAFRDDRPDEDRDGYGSFPLPPGEYFAVLALNDFRPYKSLASSYTFTVMSYNTARPKPTRTTRITQMVPNPTDPKPTVLVPSPSVSVPTAPTAGDPTVPPVGSATTPAPALDSESQTAPPLIYTPYPTHSPAPVSPALPTFNPPVPPTPTLDPPPTPPTSDPPPTAPPLIYTPYPTHSPAPVSPALPTFNPPVPPTPTLDPPPTPPTSDPPPTPSVCQDLDIRTCRPRNVYGYDRDLQSLPSSSESQPAMAQDSYGTTTINSCDSAFIVEDIRDHFLVYENACLICGLSDADLAALLAITKEFWFDFFQFTLTEFEDEDIEVTGVQLFLGKNNLKPFFEGHGRRLQGGGDYSQEYEDGRVGFFVPPQIDVPSRRRTQSQVSNSIYGDLDRFSRYFTLSYMSANADFECYLANLGRNIPAFESATGVTLLPSL